MVNRELVAKSLHTLKTVDYDYTVLPEEERQNLYDMIIEWAMQQDWTDELD